MRIALLPSAYAPAVGGVEELTARLAHRLAESGDEVEVWTIRHPRELPAREEIDRLTVRRFELPLPRLAAGSVFRFPRHRGHALRELSAAADEFRPDLLHVQCFSANGIYATWLARRLGVPLVVTLQGETVMDDNDIFERSLALRLGLRHGLRRADAVTACSGFVLDDAERRFGLRPGKGSVIPNGVDAVERTERQSLQLPFERFVLGLGRIVEKKGFDLLLEAFGRLAARQPEVGLVIAGDGPARAGLVEAVRTAGLETRVVLPGRLDRGQVAWAMEAAEVFVLPSRVEPFGIVVLEALRAGCPAVVSSHGGAAEKLDDGEDVLVADPLDDEALAVSIERLLTDRALAGKLADAGRRRVVEFSWGELAAKYRRLYSAALAGSL